MAVKKYSDLQLKVLTFYREYLKLASSKPQPLQDKMKQEARALMEKNRGIKRTNFNYIEFLLRQESNKLRMLKEANIQNIRKV